MSILNETFFEEHIANYLIGSPLYNQRTAADFDIEAIAAAYLDKKCASIDTVISTQERRIALLKELKQSVITEAVTGKIKVC